MSRLVMLIGVAAAGKTHLAYQLKDSGEVDEVVSSDAIRLELFGTEEEQANNSQVFDELHKRVRNFLKEGKNVCYDATNLSCKKRMNFLKTLEGIEVQKECIVVMTSFEDCMMHQSGRARQVPEEVIRHQIKRFQCPFYYEGWDAIKIHWISHIPIEWFMEKNKIPHDNPNHELDIYDHMIKTAQLFDNKYGAPWMERVYKAARYHDVGKFFCKEFKNIRGVETEEAHYYCHQNAGAYFYLLDKYNAEAQGIDDALYTATLIQWHMEMMIRDKRGIKNLRRMVGKKEFGDLKRIQECDGLAH